MRWPREGGGARRSAARALLLLLLAMLGPASAGQHLRSHLGTKAPYAARVRIPHAPSLHDTPDPPGYKPVHLWMLARHGSRWPTAKRMQQLNSLEHFFRNVAAPASPVGSPHRGWMANWTSPVAGLGDLAGELSPTGDAEMWGLARRLRQRFPQLAEPPYVPRRCPLISTAVPRAAQSAAAFADGFFGRWLRPSSSSSSSSSSSGAGDGGCGERDGGVWVAQPTALSMLPRHADPLLRFFETCPAYIQHEARARSWLAPWMQAQVASHVLPGLQQRLQLPPGLLQPCHVEALWQVCTVEAAQAGSSEAGSDACGLLTRADAALLEWLDDVRLYETQGPGAEVNYRISAPLLADLAASLTAAAAAAAGSSDSTAAGRGLQRMRLHFAHCETLTPLVSLLGVLGPEPWWQQQQAGAAPSDDELQLQQQLAAQLAATPGGSVSLPRQDGSDEALELLLSEDETTLAEVLEDLPLIQAAATSSDNRHPSHQELKRRRLTAAREPGHAHAHGPEADGCSVAGQLPRQRWLPPPRGWAPPFEPRDTRRAWRSGRVAPLGGNLMLVLYVRDSGGGGDDGGDDDALVRVVHNEQVLRVPGCTPAGASGLDCRLSEFLDRAIGDKACAAALEQHCGLLAAAGGVALTADALPLVAFERRR